MSKRLSVQASKSPFADLVKINQQPEAVAVSTQPAIAGGLRGGKSSDPAYVKLTTYIRRGTHLEVKKRLLGGERDISVLVEELLGTWLADGQGSGK